MSLKFISNEKSKILFRKLGLNVEVSPNFALNQVRVGLTFDALIGGSLLRMYEICSKSSLLDKKISAQPTKQRFGNVIGVKRRDSFKNRKTINRNNLIEN